MRHLQLILILNFTIVFIDISYSIYKQIKKTNYENKWNKFHKKFNLIVDELVLLKLGPEAIEKRKLYVKRNLRYFSYNQLCEMLQKH